MNTLTQMTLGAMAMGVSPPTLRTPVPRKVKYKDVPEEERDQWLTDNPVDAQRIMNAVYKRIRKVIRKGNNMMRRAGVKFPLMIHAEGPEPEVECVNIQTE